MPARFCSSDFWDWDLTWNTEIPIFTTCFQKVAFIWGPITFFWIFMPLEVFWTGRKREKAIPWSPLNLFKAVAALLLLTLAGVDVVHHADRDAAPVEFYTPCMVFLTMMAVLLLLLWMRRSGVVTSGTLFLFWLWMTVGTGANYYVVMQKTFNEAFEYDQEYESYHFTTTVLYFGLALTEFLLHCFADRRVDPGSIPRRENPELRTSFLSRLTFWWFNPMVLRGYKTPLTSSDVWELSDSNRSETLQKRFNRYWLPRVEAGKSKRRKLSGAVKDPPDCETNLGRLSIVVPLLRTFGVELFAVGFLKLAASVITFANPVLLDLLITFVSSDEPYWKGLCYGVGMFFAAAIESLLLGQYEYRIATVAMRIRSCIIAVVYQKALTLSTAARRNYTVGEVVNLMAVDTQRTMDYIQRVFVLLSAPLQIGIALYFLWQQLGVAALGGMAVLILMFPVNSVITTYLKRFQNSLMQHKDRRTKLMNEILNGIKMLKLYAWENSFIREVMQIRAREVADLRAQAYVNGAVSFTFLSVPFLVSLVSFATFILVDRENVLDANRAFVSLSLFNILRQPMVQLPVVVNLTAMFLVSLKRINKYLRSQEIQPDVVQHDPEEEDAVVIESGTFSWTCEESPVLKDINLRIKQGSLAAIVGQVGVGKSSILSALLGEMVNCSGRVNVKGSVAYVPQQAWIQNATLRRNVLFTKPYDAGPYRNVLDACALMPDLEMLPGGDETEIGEKGINLSGGQKQRVSLARAVYNDADVYYLDDPLSAVDAHVGKHIFERVIGPRGMLREKTRVLVTHRISVLPEVDTIVVVQGGRISEMGSYAELLARKGAFAGLLLQYIQETDAVLPPEELSLVEEIAASVGVAPEIVRQLSRKSEGGDECDTGGKGDHASLERRKSDIGTRSRRSESKSRQTTFTQEKGTRLIEKEAMEKGSVKSSVYLEYFRCYGQWRLACTLASYAVQTGFGLAYNLWLSAWSNDALDPEKIRDSRLRDVRLGVYGALGFGEVTFILVSALLLNLSCVRASRILHDGMLLHILRAPMSFFETTPLGRILNRFSKDVDTADVTIRFNFRIFMNNAVRAVPALIVISLETPFFLLALLPLAAIYVLLQKFYIPTSRQLKRLESTTRSPIYSHFSETLTGCQCIRAFRAQGDFARRSDRLVDLNNESYYSSLGAGRWLSIRLEFLGYCIVLSAALLAVFTRDTLSPGLAGLSISYALQVTNVLNALVRTSTDIETNIVSVERCLEYTKTPTEAEWSREETRPEDNWPDEGAIDFVDYSTRYREGLDLVLENITCSINSGERCAIVGRTGAGKSSLALALFRLLEAAGGKILIDGVEIAALGLHDLRSKLTIIPQDPFLFTGSLRMNLDPFETYSDEDLWGALDLAHLKEFVASLDRGLQHEISEGGENLSAGQRQLVCLARAVLRQSRVLVLDEATAAVDVETDRLIQSTIRAHFARCTLLTIAHRLDTVLDYDRVIVLERGRVKEMGRPDDLLKDENSAFRAMARDAAIV